MPERVLEIQAFAPLLWRDGRPFAQAEGSETAAQSLPLPLPSTVAGFVRTQVGRRLGVRFRDDHSALQNLHGLQVCSPLLVRGDEFVLPAPRDAVVFEEKAGQTTEVEVSRLRFADQASGGTNLPDGMRPLVLDDERKAATGYTFWSQKDMTAWLLGRDVIPRKIAGLPCEQRIHVGIDPASGKASEGVLYSVGYRPLESLEDGQYHDWRIRARASLETEPEALGFLGGESRPVRVTVRDELGKYWFDCPSEIKETVGSSKRVRMVLATPAIFEHGWKPVWVDRSGSGVQHLPRGLSKVRLRLVSAAVGRREAVSGWNLREDRPKAVRWMVPAGSVYFFEIEGGNPSDLLESWLRPVSDNEQDRKDGFGLALWGVW
ncbi:MAG: type III-B CRISPR module-associated protein Cmr3 [Truepera sp.]|nr:type III-B CRISPR module-associated protein Cmr3 [Truepera sp.]